METRSKIFFIDKNLKEELAELRNGKIEEQELSKHLNQAFQNLMNNAYCGIQIPKKLIDTIQNNEAIVFSVILEWMDHKIYERRFNY